MRSLATTPRTLALGAALLTLFGTTTAAWAQTTDTTAPGTATPDTAVPSTTTTTDAGTADTSTRPRSRFRIGPEVGIYLPTQGKTRNRFGGSWVSFGVGIGPIRPAEFKGKIGVDLDFFYHSRGDNHALVAPLGISYRRGLTPGSSGPYAGASVNLVLTDLKSPQDNVSSGLRGAAGGSVFLGTTLSNSAFVEARYLAVSKVKGFDVSGAEISTGFRF